MIFYKVSNYFHHYHAATPNWFDLIKSLSDEVSKESRKTIERLIKSISEPKNPGKHCP